MIRRKIKDEFDRILKRGKSILLLGPRQTGKTTFLRDTASDLKITFLEDRIRLRYEKNPSLLSEEVGALFQEKKKNSLPLVILDEVQKVPGLLNDIQALIDDKKAQFILTGSSARKLRTSPDLNLLPGRIVTLRMTPLSFLEAPEFSLNSRLIDGSLPGIVTVFETRDREQDLRSYAETYLEEEVRREALVRNIGPFARFLELAAIESGRVINASKIASDIGVSSPTIQSYFEILKDCLITENIDPITKSKTRKKLTRSKKFLFFDLGVKRIACHEGREIPAQRLGPIFEEWVGLEILRSIYQGHFESRLLFWRDPDGPEVDWVLDRGGTYVPIEVKWSEAPREKDTEHLQTFMREYPQAKKGFVICRCPRPLKLSSKIIALPWQQMEEIFE